MAYYSGRKVFDYMYGLPEPEVARLVAQRGERFDTPTDPALETLWRARAPEYLLEDDAIMDAIIAKAARHPREFCDPRHQVPRGPGVPDRRRSNLGARRATARWEMNCL